MGRDNSPYKRLANALCEDAFLRKLGISRREMRRVFGAADWKSLLEPLFPIRERQIGRASCRERVSFFV